MKELCRLTGAVTIFDAALWPNAHALGNCSPGAANRARRREILTARRILELSRGQVKCLPVCLNRQPKTLKPRKQLEATDQGH